MKRKILGGLAAAAMLAGGFALISSAPAAASEVCGPLDSGKIDTSGDPATVTVTAPEGKLIDGYCVKAGSSKQGDGPVYVDVDPPVKTITFGHPSGKDVSHYSVSYTDAPPPTTSTTTTTTEPPPVTTLPPPVTTLPPPVTTQPPPVTTVPPPVTTQPPPVTTEPPCVGICGPATVPTTTPPPGDPCIIDGVRVPEGEYVIVDYPDNEGTTEWGFLPCSRTPEEPPATTTPPPTITELPETGSTTWGLVAAALAFLTLGGGALTLARRKV